MDQIELLKTTNPDLLKELVQKYRKTTKKEALIKKRQAPCGAKLISKIFDMGIDKWVDKEGLRRNFNRNKKLIDLSLENLPKKMCDKVIKTYKSKEIKKPNMMNIMHYCRRKKFKALMNKVNIFLR